MTASRQRGESRRRSAVRPREPIDPARRGFVALARDSDAGRRRDRASLICTEGVASAACHRLLAALARQGTAMNDGKRVAARSAKRCQNTPASGERKQTRDVLRGALACDGDVGVRRPVPGLVSKLS